MFGDNIEKLRTELKSIVVASGASESSISEVSGFDRNVLGKFIRGEQEMRLKTLVRILETMGYGLKIIKLHTKNT